jgi:phosphoribosylformylglycinamidine cyclo-ligase
MDSNTDKYALRGVASGKEDVHQAISGLSTGLYPKAFCKILPDIVGQHPDYINLMHADTAGTKTSLAYLYWKETGDLSVWEGIAQDALVMNLDDMACVGCTTDILVSSNIARNKHIISGDVITTLIQWLEKYTRLLKDLGIGIHPAGGETADVGDIMRTIDVGYATFARLHRDKLLVNDIRPGQKIVAFASYGQATYESAYNSGMGSNGLTSARHDVLSSYYRDAFPESYAPETPKEVVYAGKHRLTDTLSFLEGNFTIAQLLLSPTRTYLPVIHRIFKEVPAGIHGMIHNTGGGLTKVSKFITEGLVRKHNLLPIPPIFRLIAEENGSSMQEMVQVFNMGQRLECYCDEQVADQLIRIGSDFNIEAQIIGEVVTSDKPGVEITYGDQSFYFGQ